MRFHHRALSSAIAAVLATATAFAAEDGGSSADASRPNRDVQSLDTVNVTATKRETPLQKTPIAVTAITPDTLSKERVMTVSDITHLVPSFAATTEGDHDVVTLTLRGIGNDSAKTEYADPEVALFVDGIYTPRAEAAASLLLDLESVEVLRGPQGTLWGRNSTVGAVNFQTAKPVLGDQSGYAEIEAGNYGHFGARAAVNVPLSDTFAFRVAVAQEQHDGYVDYQNPNSQLPSVAQQQAAYIGLRRNAAPFKPIDPSIYVTGGQKYNAQDQSAARVSALWTPNAQFTWNASFEYFRDRGTPNANLMQDPRAGPGFLVDARRHRAVSGSQFVHAAQPHGLCDQRRHDAELHRRLQQIQRLERLRPGRRRARADQLRHRLDLSGRPHQLVALPQQQPRTRSEIHGRQHARLDPRLVLRGGRQLDPLRHPDLQRHAARDCGVAGFVHPAEGNGEFVRRFRARRRGT